MRKADSHKGENGRVLVVAGSYDYPGACFLAVSAAVASLRVGGDLVTVAAPEKVAWFINTVIPDIITVKLKGKYLSYGHHKTIEKLREKSDIILLGPGIGRRKTTFSLVRRLCKGKKNKVIDADALKAVKLQDVDNAVLTPHKGELETLLKNSGIFIKNYSELKKYCGSNVILLKGKEDLIISRNEVRRNKTGNAGMTVGGTGDILAGIITGLIAQGFGLEKAAYKGANLTGRIGDKLRKEYGYGFIASDFLSLIAKEKF
ncbi:MAG: NAD(P)H-hydrate dehydratase [Candidatus Nanoarchaeia archaeon]